MNIAIGSAFRNSGANAPRYMERVKELIDSYDDDVSIRVIAVEGDSTDNTRDALVMAAEYHRIPLSLLTCNHGGPVFGSVESEARFTALSKVGNAIFDGVRHADDVLVYIESDLIWDPETMKSLIFDAMTGRQSFQVFSPLIMARDNFYDIWAFRKSGQRFSPFAPFYPGLDEATAHGQIFEVDSVGSCLVMAGAYARACRIRDNNCLVGWCADAQSRGLRIGVRGDLKVRQL